MILGVQGLRTVSLPQRHVNLVIWVLMNFQIKGLDFGKGQVDRLGKMFHSPRVSLPRSTNGKKKETFCIQAKWSSGH